MNRGFNGRFEYFSAAVISDRDVISGLCEVRPLGANAMRDELRVFLRFPAGPALVPQDVMGRKLPGQVKEKPLHRAHNELRLRLFLID
jgi:hypothetical protein